MCSVRHYDQRAAVTHEISAICSDAFGIAQFLPVGGLVLDTLDDIEQRLVGG